jgi:hypothetical protein
MSNPVSFCNESLPEPLETIYHNWDWPWTRGGHASCLIAEHVYTNFIALSLTLSAQGFGEPEDYREATLNLASSRLFGLVQKRLENNLHRILHMDQTSAILLKL